MYTVLFCVVIKLVKFNFNMQNADKSMFSTNICINPSVYILVLQTVNSLKTLTLPQCDFRTANHLSAYFHGKVNLCS
jgi:hypothetical protein